MSKKAKPARKQSAPAVTGQAVAAEVESPGAESRADAPQLGDVGPESSAAQGSAVAAEFEPLDESQPEPLGDGEALPGSPPAAGFTPKILDDAPPADAGGEPADRCPKCGDHETEGEPKTIRETHAPDVDRRTGRRYAAVAWRVVVCASCRQRRVRKVLLGSTAEPQAEPGAR